MFVDISDRVDMLDRVDIVNSVDQLQNFYKCLKGFKIFLKKSFMFLNFPGRGEILSKLHYFF